MAWVWLRAGIENCIVVFMAPLSCQARVNDPSEKDRSFEAVASGQWEPPGKILSKMIPNEGFPILRWSELYISLPSCTMRQHLKLFSRKPVKHVVKVSQCLNLQRFFSYWGCRVPHTMTCRSAFSESCSGRNGCGVVGSANNYNLADGLGNDRAFPSHFQCLPNKKFLEITLQQFCGL